MMKFKKSLLGLAAVGVLALGGRLAAHPPRMSGSRSS